LHGEPCRGSPFLIAAFKNDVQRGENTQKGGENWAVKPVKPENVPNLQHNSQIDNKLFVHN
jgi:hypothetical protein